MQLLPTFDLILFGGTGDLAMRKLLPALYWRFACGQISSASRIIGTARGELTREGYLAQVRVTCETHLGKEFEQKTWHGFADRLSYAKVDAKNDADFAGLVGTLAGREDHIRIFFLSTAPNLFAPICEGLARHALATPKSRVVLEKPLGHDRASSA